MKNSVLSVGPQCAVCGKPVQLELSKTNESGQAVHEECYAHQISNASNATAIQARTNNPPTVARDSASD